MKFKDVKTEFFCLGKLLLKEYGEENVDRVWMANRLLEIIKMDIKWPFFIEISSEILAKEDKEDVEMRNFLLEIISKAADLSDYPKQSLYALMELMKKKSNLNFHERLHILGLIMRALYKLPELEDTIYACRKMMLLDYDLKDYQRKTIYNFGIRKALEDSSAERNLSFIFELLNLKFSSTELDRVRLLQDIAEEANFLENGRFSAFNRAIFDGNISESGKRLEILKMLFRMAESKDINSLLELFRLENKANGKERQSTLQGLIEDGIGQETLEERMRYFSALFQSEYGLKMAERKELLEICIEIAIQAESAEKKVALLEELGQQDGLNENEEDKLVIEQANIIEMVSMNDKK